MFSCIICTCIGNFLLLFLSQFLPPPKLSPLFLQLFVIGCWASWTDYFKFLILLSILLIFSLWLCFLRHSQLTFQFLLQKCLLWVSFFKSSFFFMTVPFCGILTFVYMDRYLISVATVDISAALCIIIVSSSLLSSLHWSLIFCVRAFFKSQMTSANQGEWSSVRVPEDSKLIK